MIATFVIVAALAAGDHPSPVSEPGTDLPVHKTPGPAIKLPCKVASAQAVDRVQLFVSDNRGKTWTLFEEITPEKTGFTFLARKPGEYWFTTRVKKKDGTFDPASTEDLVVMQRVEVETGTGYVEPVYPPTAKRPAADVARELEDELTRVEMELIRQEIKKLSESKKFTPETGDKIDRLRIRLRDVVRRQRDDNPPSFGFGNGPPSTLFPSPYAPPPAVPDERIPPTATPTGPVLPPAPAPAEAPMPRARG